MNLKRYENSNKNRIMSRVRLSYLRVLFDCPGILFLLHICTKRNMLASPRTTNVTNMVNLVFTRYLFPFSELQEDQKSFELTDMMVTSTMKSSTDTAHTIILPQARHDSVLWCDLVNFILFLLLSAMFEDLRRRTDYSFST